MEAIMNLETQPKTTGDEVTMDSVINPRHYRDHPSGVECITITEHMGFNLGNAIKYIWRADLKGDAIADLNKARWYIDRELMRLGTQAEKMP